jgi:aminotransferase
VAATELSAHDFATRLLQEARVAVVPGDAFGPGGAGHVRCAYATGIDQIEEALRRIERFLQHLELDATPRSAAARENLERVPTGV